MRICDPGGVPPGIGLRGRQVWDGLSYLATFVKIVKMKIAKIRIGDGSKEWKIQVLAIGPDEPPVACNSRHHGGDPD
jgi:hypothetical protein